MSVLHVPSVCTYKLLALVRRVELQESPQMLGATWLLSDSEIDSAKITFLEALPWG